MIAEGRRILVASNRGPVSFGHDEAGRVVPSRGAGGLVTALSGALAASGGLWIAAAMSEDDRTQAGRPGRLPGPPAGLRPRHVRTLLRRHLEPRPVVPPPPAVGRAPRTDLRRAGRGVGRVPGRERDLRPGPGRRWEVRRPPGLLPRAGLSPGPRTLAAPAAHPRCGHRPLLPHTLRRPLRPAHPPPAHT